MDVYDFDGTIYKGDSGVNFIKFVFGKHPFFMTAHLLKSLKYVFLYKLKKIEFQKMKEYLFSFVSKLNNLNILTHEFAEKNKNKIKEYYKKQRKDSDVIVSASLDFYLIPLCNAMGLNNIICTKYDIKNGKIIGENCKSIEKVKRFEEVYGNITIENSYGDSKSDLPMIQRAQNRFYDYGRKIKKGKMIF